MDSSIPDSEPTLCAAAEGPSPFDNPQADTILRSSDLVDFHVHSIILSEASPFFKQMFSLPQASEAGSSNTSEGEHRDGGHIIPVSEDSRTLDSLLRLCYPVADPVLKEVTSVRAVLAVALKYEMVEASALMTAALESFAERQPLRVWVIACHLGLEPLACLAARHTISEQALDQLGTFPEELEGISAGLLYRLLLFRKRAVSQDFRFLSPLPPQRSSGPHETHDNTYKFSLETEPFADIVCHSSDGRTFLFHRVLLSMASPILHELLLDPPNTSIEGAVITPPTDSSLPGLRLVEDGDTLQILLAMCSSLDQPRVNKGEIPVLLKAAKKYGMNKIQQRLEVQWTDFIAASPVRAYLLARMHSLDEGAQRAAEYLSIQPRDIGNEYFPEMEQSPARVYYELLKFNRRCVEVSEITKKCRNAVNARNGTVTLFPNFTLALKSRACTCDASFPVSCQQGAISREPKKKRRKGVQRSVNRTDSAEEDYGRIHTCTSCMTLHDSIRKYLDDVQTNLRLLPPTAPGMTVPTSAHGGSEQQQWCPEFGSGIDSQHLNELHKFLVRQIAEA